MFGIPEHCRQLWFQRCRCHQGAGKPQRRITIGKQKEKAEIAGQIDEARYTNPVALQLRGMNMLFEGLKEKGSLIMGLVTPQNFDVV